MHVTCSTRWHTVGPDIVSWLDFLERTPLEVDSAGTIYIGFVIRLPQRNVRLATKIGSTWADQPLANGESVSLNLDENDQLNVCFTNGQNQLEYRVPGTSTAEIVDSTRTVGETDMVVDAAGVVHSAYESSEGLRYAVRTTAGWSLSPIAPSGAFPSIDVGPLTVRVAYADAGALCHV